MENLFRWVRMGEPWIKFFCKQHLHQHSVQQSLVTLQPAMYDPLFILSLLSYANSSQCGSCLSLTERKTLSLSCNRNLPPCFPSIRTFTHQIIKKLQLSMLISCRNGVYFLLTAKLAVKQGAIKR